MWNQIYQILIPVLSGLAVITIGAALLLARNARRAPLQARLRELQGDSDASVGAVPPAPMVGVIDRIGRVVSSREPSNLKRELAEAGFHSRSAPTVYLGTKMILFLIGLPLFSAIAVPLHIQSATKFTLVATGALTLFFLPNLFVWSARDRRRTEIRAHLPDAIDLLEISVSAGMGLDQAWNAVADEVRNVSTTLADEMALTNLEIHLGATRAVAMRHMADRTGSQDLGSLVAILVQSDRFGTSISDALRTFANSLREARSLRAQEYAEKLAVKLIFPMVGCLFPPVVIVMAVPGLLKVFRALNGQGS